MFHSFQLLARVGLSVTLLGCGAVLIGVAAQSLHWSFDLAAQFLLPAVVVASVAALIAGLARLPLMAAGFLGIAVLAALTAGPWTTSPRSVPAEAPRFSVLLFNVWYRNQQVSEIVQMIRRENPHPGILVGDPVARNLQRIRANLFRLQVERRVVLGHDHAARFHVSK